MPDHFFVYPDYLLKGTPRSLGRRVPSVRAPTEVTLDAIVKAATALGFRATAEPDKQYPRLLFVHPGRVRVVKKSGTSKARFLRDLADELVRSGAGGRGH